MDNTELEPIDELPVDSQNDSDNNVWIITTLFFAVTSAGLFVKNMFTKKQLKKEREKNASYQMALQKHQAIIAALNNDKERQAYRDRLWEAIKSETEE